MQPWSQSGSSPQQRKEKGNKTEREWGGGGNQIFQMPLFHLPSLETTAAARFLERACFRLRDLYVKNTSDSPLTLKGQQRGQLRADVVSLPSCAQPLPDKGGCDTHHTPLLPVGPAFRWGPWGGGGDGQVPPQLHMSGPGLQGSLAALWL